MTEQSAHNYRNYCESYNIVESKSALENFLRRDLFNVYESSQSFEAIESYIELAFELANELKIENSIPFLLIEDIVEIASFDRLGQLLPYLDRKASEWCSVYFVAIVLLIFIILEIIIKERKWVDIT